MHRKSFDTLIENLQEFTHQKIPTPYDDEKVEVLQSPSDYEAAEKIQSYLEDVLFVD